MAHVRFTNEIRRHASCPDAEVPGSTVRDVLEAYFRQHPEARDYVVDDQQALRQHMVVFVDGRPISDRMELTDPVRRGGLVNVTQARTGG